MRKAFTLIELLVVIAIIAILAAILFPVFAQAKASAKKIAGVSNSKQLSLGVLMYENDVDDMVPPDTAWGTPASGLPLCFSATGCFGTWNYLCVPYVKNAPINYDPQVAAPPDSTFKGNDLLTATSWPDFGYNYVYMCPWNGTHQAVISGTAPDQPASTVLLAEQKSVTELKTGQPYFWGFAFSTAADGPLLSEAVEVPNCGPIPQYCATNWGVGSFCATCTTVASGENTGGVAVRAGNQSIISFMDGHTKAMSPGALAVGTNWTPTIPDGNITWSSAYPASYLWSTSKTWTVQGSY
jgi:prepilin-type N-terminal cleavage/methylation domain-containing protein